MLKKAKFFRRGSQRIAGALAPKGTHAGHPFRIVCNETNGIVTLETIPQATQAATRRVVSLATRRNAGGGRSDVTTYYAVA
jgi:hypothetical protein